MRRGLFITHDVSNYGASRSLQLLLRNYAQTEIDLVALRILRKCFEEENIRKKFGNHLGDIKSFFLPFDFCYRGKPEDSFRLFLSRCYLKALCILDSRALNNYIRDNHYDFIHLNSLVLHPLITRERPFIIHVREILDDHGKGEAHKSLEKAHGVIFIDEATREPFLDLRLRNWVVLNNPIDMMPLRDYPLPDLLDLGIDVERDTIFAIIGRIIENKGVDFVIRNFRKLQSPRVRLLIVGSGIGTDGYEEKCRKLAGEDSRIIFWGEESDILRIYRIADYIIRGEDRSCVGRTIYEGLYAGCGVVIPGDDILVSRLFEYATFQDKFHPYPPRNEERFLDVLTDLSDQKEMERTFRSNINEYVDQFHNFVIKARG